MAMGSIKAHCQKRKCNGKLNVVCLSSRRSLICVLF